MPILNLSSPWMILYRELTAMFQNDPEIKVILNEEKYKIFLYVDNSEKAEALELIIERRKIFGNINVDIIVVPANDVSESKSMTIPEAFEIAFKNNPALSYVKIPTRIFEVSYYVVFKNEVVQYFNDDISDVNGYCSTLYQEIAKDIFKKELCANYCTDLPENLGKPLGEWP